MKLRHWIISGLLLLGDSHISLAEVVLGQAAPSCSLSKIGGGAEKKLDSFKGQVVYVDFWASWCGPCAQSFPFMNKLHRELSSKGLAIVGVNLDEKADDATGFLTKTPAHFEILADVGGSCPQGFGVKAMPSSYLIDRHGVVRHIHLGFKPSETEALRKEVDALLLEAASTP